MLPRLQVLLDDGTGTFPADISAYVMSADGYSISRGRDDWQGSVTAGQLDLTLNNSTGIFTPGYVGGFGLGPFGGGGFVDQKIRVKETINGVTYTRFTGYVKAWPVSWPATVSTFSTVRLTATDAQARAERRTLRSMLEEEVMVNSPSAYYTLGEAEGAASAGDSSGIQSTPLTAAGTGTAVTFGTGTGPGTDGLTAAQFFGGQYLQGPTFVAPAAFSFAFWFNAAALTSPGVDMPLVEVGGLAAVISGATGQLSGAGPSVVDGLTHFAALVWDGSQVVTYLDGAVISTTAGTWGPSGQTFKVGKTFANLPTFTGTMSHVAAFPAAVPIGNLAPIYTAGAGAATAGDSRIARLASYAGIPVGALDLSLTTVPAQPTTGAGAMSAIQQVTDAELGVAFVEGGGNLVFHNRNRGVTKTAPDLTLSSQWVTPDVQPVVDDAQIVNYYETTAAGTGAMTVVRKATSESTHGRYPTSQTYLVQTDAEAVDRANWIVGQFAEPTPRYGTLTINLFGMTAAQAQSVIAAIEVDCWLRVTSMAPQTPGGTVADVVVQGWRETATGETWTVVCNVVSRSLFAAWVLGDATAGVLDTSTKLYV